MLAEDVSIVDIDVYQLKNFLSIFKFKKGKPVILILYENERILKIIHTEKGVIRGEEKFKGRETLKKIFTREIQNVIAVERGFLKKFPSIFSEKVNYDEDFLKQIFRGWEILKEEFGKRVYIYPETLYKLKFLNYSLVSKFLKIFIPENSVFIFILFKDREIFSSLIIGIKNRMVSLITTTENLQEKIKEKCGIENFRMFVTVAEQQYNMPVAGIFKDISSGRIIIYPKSLRLKIIALFVNKLTK